MTSKIQTSLRLDGDKLAEAKTILERLGLNFSEAVNIFTSLVVAQKGLPFAVALPSADTAAALREAQTGKNVQPYSLDALQQDAQAV